MSFTKKAFSIFLVLAVLLVLNELFTNGLGDFQLNRYYARIVMLIGISITLAVSLNLINGMTGQFSLGHAGFMAVGGYTAAFVTTTLLHALYGADAQRVLSGAGPGEWVESGVLLAGLVAAAAAAALAGLIVGIPSLRLKGDYLAIVTLGFGEIIRVILLNIQTVGGATGFRDLTFADGSSLPVQPLANFFWIFGVAIFTIALVRNIQTSTFGRALAAIREDEIAAEAMGVNTTRYKVLAFVISSSLAGVAGGLFGHLFGNLLSPAVFTFVRSIEVIIMIVLGGIGSITGAVLGATILTILPEALRDADEWRPGMRMVIYSLLLIFLMIFRPQGIMGRREFGLSWLFRWSRTQPATALTDARDVAVGTDARPVEDEHQRAQTERRGTL